MTTLQLEAAKLLLEHHEAMKAAKALYWGVGTFLNFFAPGIGYVACAIPYVLSLMQWRYVAELEEVVRGERTTLPTPPPDSDPSYYAS